MYTYSVIDHYEEKPFVYRGDKTGAQPLTLSPDWFEGDVGSIVFRAYVQITYQPHAQRPEEVAQAAECLYYRKKGDDLYLFKAYYDFYNFERDTVNVGDTEAEEGTGLAPDTTTAQERSPVTVFLLCSLLAVLLAGALVTGIVLFVRRKRFFRKH